MLIAAPHFLHTALGIQALEAGKHVLVEKPISVHKADAERLIDAHRRPNQVFAAMFNQRTDPFFQNLRQLVQSGDLGEIRRVHWTITNWFRTEAYYHSSDWKATWAGEGGGVLLNQCPHNLDLYQWIFGMPSTVRAFCNFGRYHDIEVEDDVTAYLEYTDGMTAVISTSTGEAPGTNRLEVAAERGKVVIENDQFLFTRNEVAMSEFSRTDPGRFSTPATCDVRIPIEGHGPQHNGILANFVDAILDGAPLIAPAEEGIFSLELANSFLLSSLENRSVQLPIDALIVRTAPQEVDRFIRPAEAKGCREAIRQHGEFFSLKLRVHRWVKQATTILRKERPIPSARRVTSNLPPWPLITAISTANAKV